MQLVNFREAKYQQAEQQGWPGRKDEQWKYTNLKGLQSVDLNYRLSPPEKSDIEAVRKHVQGMRLKDANAVVFVNGKYVSELSARSSNELEISTYQSWLENKKNEPRFIQIQSKFDRVSFREKHHNMFVDLNAATFQDGVMIEVRPHKVVKGLIQVMHFFTGSLSSGVGSLRTIVPRHTYLLGRGSQACVMEQYYSVAEAPYFTNAVSDMVLESGSSLEFVKAQHNSVNSYHIHQVRAFLGRDSQLYSYELTLQGGVTRNNLNVALTEEGAGAMVNGLFLAKGSEHVDNHTLLHHDCGHTSSHQLYKGVLSGTSRGVFNGKILISENAQKVDSSQLSKNLLLSGDAEIDAKPELEVYADDVKANHGATVGQIDAEQLFYLMSRGISKPNAMTMLMEGFVKESTSNLQTTSLRKLVDQFVKKGFQQFTVGTTD
ncbi:MAG: Fe-S cluster assembly protein SufD [Pseudobdellovibrionaceae bacterium]|nr:Fe-S cluster assembly protein SufD [Bdellovibrionales bacterium]USN46993.1 MAG: Fe-S cluster assembly protein SufD [Pseudobdellovibrionaceae bacterium]